LIFKNISRLNINDISVVNRPVRLFLSTQYGENGAHTMYDLSTTAAFIATKHISLLRSEEKNNRSSALKYVEFLFFTAESSIVCEGVDIY
jgi:hypothetical protein